MAQKMEKLGLSHSPLSWKRHRRPPPSPPTPKVTPFRGGVLPSLVPLPGPYPSVAPASPAPGHCWGHHSPQSWGERADTQLPQAWLPCADAQRAGQMGWRQGAAGGRKLCWGRRMREDMGDSVGALDRHWAGTGGSVAGTGCLAGGVSLPRERAQEGVSLCAGTGPGGGMGCREGTAPRQLPALPCSVRPAEFGTRRVMTRTGKVHRCLLCPAHLWVQPTYRRPEARALRLQG